jgi:hypothetical protein
MNANVKTALELLKPFPFVPFTELTREGVKSYVDAQKALLDVMVKPAGELRQDQTPCEDDPCR